MNGEVCDVLIVGAGPAGLASAVELLQSGAGRVMIVEKGEPIQQRYCSALVSGKCQNCQTCAVLSGVGGASGMLGGKLCFFPAGERLAGHCGFSPSEANQMLVSFLERNGLSWMLKFPDGVIPEGRFESIGTLDLKDYHARPFLRPFLQMLFHRLVENVRYMSGIIKTRAEAIDIVPGKDENRFGAVYKHYGEWKTVAVRKAVVLAAGRSGSHWLSHLLPSLGVTQSSGTVDVGVRLEVPSIWIADLPPNLQDPKFKIYEGTPNEVRTLCWSRGGQLSLTNAGGTCLVDGHFGEQWQSLTSVSIVSRIVVPEGCFPLTYAMKQFDHVLSVEEPVHQSLAEFLGIRNPKRGRTPRVFESHSLSTSQETNLRSAITKPIVTGIIDMLEQLNPLLGGRLLDGRNGRVYAPVIDKFWKSPSLDGELMTAIPGLYVAGDATDLGRGILQGLFSGIVVAQSIVRYELEPSLMIWDHEPVLAEVLWS